MKPAHESAEVMELRAALSAVCGIAIDGATDPAKVPGWYAQKREAERDALRASNAALRVALEELSSACEYSREHGTKVMSGDLAQARAALAGSRT